MELQVNGVLVNPSQIGRTELDKIRQTTTQTWYGVALKSGDNTITAQIAGQPETARSFTVQVRGEATRLTLETQEARIPADGRSSATLEGRLFDAQGNRSNRDAIVTLTTTAGEFLGADADPDQPGFQVSAQQGQFTAQLRSGLEAKTVSIRAITGTLEAYTQVDLETNLRSSLATGVIDLRFGRRGTNFHQSLREFLPRDRDNRYQLEARGAVFATGKIGNWLFTGAYNSDRPLNQSCDDTVRLFREQQACDYTYSVYGDSSQSTVVTPSIDQTFLKLERTSPVANAGSDFVMWGDYRTDEFARKSQEFTRFTRQLHGFKGNYNFGNLQVTGIFANHLQRFQRDTIAPDGTSGFYFLSRRRLVEGSESVFLELEELQRPGMVLERQQVSRGTDYEIDYDRGTLLFRQPILRTDIGTTGETLVRRIVVTYEYESETDSVLYGGRIQYHFSRQPNRESWIAGTYLRQDQGSQQFELYGGDVYWSIGDNAHLIAEYARSKHRVTAGGTVNGSAYRLELAGKLSEAISGRAYYRHADPGFANDTTVSFMPGQTRYGAQVAAKVSPTTQLRFQYDHEDNKGTAPRSLTAIYDFLTPVVAPGTRLDNSLTTLTAGIQQTLGSAELTVDWLHRDRVDRRVPSLSATSDQLRSRLTVPLTKTLTFLAQNDTTLSRTADPIYGDRSLLGLNWALMPGVNVLLAQHFYGKGGAFAHQSLTSLSVNGDYKLTPTTALHGRIGILGGTNQLIAQGAIGIEQTIRLSPGLKVSLAYEHVFGDFKGRLATGDQYFQPFAIGQSAASLGVQAGDSYSAAIEYVDSPNFQASARFEHRHSTEGSNTVITAGAAGKLGPALTLLLRYNQASAANQKLSGLGTTSELKLGLAYRDPHNDRFNALLRYEYRKNPALIPETLLLGSGTGSRVHLFALEAIYAPNWRWEFYGKFGFRHSRSDLAKDAIGSSSIFLGQLRAIYRLGYKWDLATEARWISQPDAGFSETAWMLEAGYYLTSNLRLSAGYSFGHVHDRDFDGSRSAGGFYAGITVKLNDLLGGFGLQKVAPPQQQESQFAPAGQPDAEAPIVPNQSQLNPPADQE